jgi:hypothetical protein
MMSSYQLFSPLVAGDMRTDSALREAMLHFGVQSAVHLLRIVRSYIAGRSDDAALNAHAAAILAGGTDSDQAGTPTLPDDVFAAVVRSVISTGADSRGPAWILDGIALFLDAAARRDSDDLAEELTLLRQPSSSIR